MKIYNFPFIAAAIRQLYQWSFQQLSFLQKQSCSWDLLVEWSEADAGSTQSKHNLLYYSESHLGVSCFLLLEWNQIASCITRKHTSMGASNVYTNEESSRCWFNNRIIFSAIGLKTKYSKLFILTFLKMINCPLCYSPPPASFWTLILQLQINIIKWTNSIYERLQHAR